MVGKVVGGGVGWVEGEEDEEEGVVVVDMLAVRTLRLRERLRRVRCGRRRGGVGRGIDGLGGEDGGRRGSGGV